MRKLFWVAVISSALATAQSFEVASIRLNASPRGEGDARPEAIRTSPDTLTIRGLTLRDCFLWAYGLQNFQVVGPASGVWGTERYDITAKAGGPVTISQLRAMLGTLLADRFKLSVHRESKMLPVYALLVAKSGSKLRESTEEGLPAFGPGTGRASIPARRVSMAELGGMLSGPLRTPVIDSTGLSSRYDFTLDLMPYLPGNTDSRRWIGPAPS